MRRRRYNRGYNRDMSSLMLSFGSEKSERFIVRKCVHYLTKHLEKFAAMDQNVLQMICWVLGSQMTAIGSFLIDQTDDELTQRQLIDDLSDAGLDPSENSEVVARHLKRSKPKTVRMLYRLIFQLLKQRHADLSYSGKSNMEKIFASMDRMFNLTKQETEFCIFLFIMSSYDEPESFFDDHLKASKFQGRKYITNILQVTWKELDRVLQNLKKIGIVEVDNRNFEFECDFLCMLQNPSSSDFAKNLYNPLDSENVPLNNHFISEDVLNHLLSLLRIKPKHATHLLFYGPPGTGKTSLACGLAREIGLPSYEISRNESNNSVSRRAALIAGMNMTNTGNGSIIVVDEADNLLNTRHSWLSRGETQDKGWLNKILEEPGTRVIWITNHIDDIEASVLRRFAFSLNFKPFNRRQRIKLWDQVLRQNKVKRYFGRKDIEKLAKNYQASAGAIDIAVKKAIEIKNDSRKDLLKSISLSLDANQRLCHQGKSIQHKDRIEDQYSIDGLNVDGDMNLVIQQLDTFDQYLRENFDRCRINMNLLLYGPPGTGKSEFARFIANKLDRELICKTYADLQSPYVGLGEQHIQAAFEEAEAEEAILVIDEVDSFLLSRERARRSWEFTFVNQFLTQMERFRGILVCTTNRLNSLDEASIRRFNHKIGFDFLTADGILHFYNLFLQPLTVNKLDNETITKIKNIKNLAPGDFKIVRDRYSFHPQSTINHRILIDALLVESKIKSNQNPINKIGF